MPLIKSASKKAFKENVETEMNANPSKDKRAQNLAIAYSVQKQARKKAKKLAYGGAAEETNEPPVPQPKKDNMRPSEEEFMADHFKKGGKVEIKDDKKSLQVEQMSDEDMRRDMEHGKPYNPNEDDQNLAYGGAAEDDGEPEFSEPEARYPSPDEDEFMADHFADGGEAHPESVADAIMDKKRRMKMAEGGQVDLSENADEEFNNEDDMSWEALRKENYSESEGLEKLDQPHDSNEHGRDLPDENEHNGETDHEFKERMADDMVDSIRKRMKSKRGY